MELSRIKALIELMASRPIAELELSENGTRIRLRVALDEMRVEGIATNLPLHRAVLRDEGFRCGGVDIHHLQRWLAAREADRAV